MKGWKGVLAVALVLWICAAFQQALAARLAIFGFKPDFLLVALGSFALVCERRKATFIGFCCGAIGGAAAFANITHYVVSRSVTGFAAGWFKQFHLENNLVVMGITVSMLTVLASLLLMFLAPPQAITPFLADTIRTAVYNGVLAVPMCLLVKWIVGPPTR